MCPVLYRVWVLLCLFGDHCAQTGHWPSAAVGWVPKGGEFEGKTFLEQSTLDVLARVSKPAP